MRNRVNSQLLSPRELRHLHHLLVLHHCLFQHEIVHIILLDPCSLHYGHCLLHTLCPEWFHKVDIVACLLILTSIFLVQELVVISYFLNGFVIHSCRSPRSSLHHLHLLLDLHIIFHWLICTLVSFALSFPQPSVPSSVIYHMHMFLFHLHCHWAHLIMIYLHQKVLLFLRRHILQIFSYHFSILRVKII